MVGNTYETDTDKAAAKTAASTTRVRSLILKEGTFVGFKAAPGCDHTRLFSHVGSVGSGTQDWSGIYVQLDVGQAIRYAPNQYDRGEEVCCIIGIKVRKGKSLDVALFADPSMTDTTIASSEKARITSNALQSSGLLEESDDKLLPLLPRLGRQGYALCVLDSEDFELAIPHDLFTEDILEAETLFILPQSKRIPSTIEKIEAVELRCKEMMQSEANNLPKEDVADAGMLGTWLCKRMEEWNLTWKSQWMDSTLVTDNAK